MTLLVPPPLTALRPMSLADIPALSALDQMSSSSPWKPAQFAAELDKKVSHFWVLDLDAYPAAGFGGFWLVETEAQLANLAIHPRVRGRGWGRQTLQWLMESARTMGAKVMTLEVRENNEPARRLYNGEGFRQTGHRLFFYEGQETALLMEKAL